MVAIIRYQRCFHTYRMGGSLIVIADAGTRIQANGTLIRQQVDRNTHLRFIRQAGLIQRIGSLERFGRITTIRKAGRNRGSATLIVIVIGSPFTAPFGHVVCVFKIVDQGSQITWRRDCRGARRSARRALCCRTRRISRIAAVAATKGDGITCCEAVIRIIWILDGNTDNTIGNTSVQITYAHPVLVIVIATAAYTVTVISNNLLATHGRTGLGPCQQVIVVATDTALVTLSTATRREQVIYLALIKIGIPTDDIAVQPRRNIHRNFCIG